MQVSRIPPGPGTVHQPLPEESDTVPEHGQKEARLYLHPIHKKVAGKGPYKTWAIRTGHGNGHTRQEERDAW